MTDPRTNLPPSEGFDRPGQPTGTPGAKPLGEEELLAWIDGDLPQSEVVRLEASSGRAGLSQRVKQIQGNRRALRSLPLDKAPPELLSRVMQALEREQLLSGNDAASLAGDHDSEMGGANSMVRELAPISIVEYREHQELRPSASSPRSWMPRLAMAAGVVLLLGGAAYWAILLAAPATPTDPIGPIALTGPRSTDAPVAPKLEESARGTSTSVAEGVSPGATLAASSESARTLASSVAEVASTAEGLALATEGRLVLRVLARTASMTRAEGSGGSRLTQPELSDAAEGWSLSREVPADVAITVLASKAASAIAGPMPEVVGPPLPEDRFAAVATQRALAPLMGPRGAFSALSSRSIDRPASLGEIESTMLLRVNASEESLEAARAALARELDADVTLERLSVSVDIPGPVDPGQVLWWTRSSNSWAPSLQVPVVIERVSVQ
jgi:hypothetical protein